MSCYRKDVVYCARSIFNDLARGRIRWSFWDLWHLTDYHGGAFVLDPTVSRGRRAYERNGRIHVCAYLDDEARLEAVTHELVHRLADEPMWAWLNPRIDSWGYDRDRFREHVARVVGRKFVKAQRRRQRRETRDCAVRLAPFILRSESVMLAVGAELNRLMGTDLDRREVARILLEVTAHA